MERKILITGGAGFIGCNLASHFLLEGDEVTILDNFSRKGTKLNLEWLKKHKRSNNLKVVKEDLRNFSKELKDSVRDKDLVFHMAAQVAVTTSVTNPREDFEINALGTFNLLEALRKSNTDTISFYASTNKVYGKLNHRVVKEKNERYEYKDLENGVTEEEQLDFYSPYGCSKGTADQYWRDYSRIYGLRNVVFRQSCIYGPRQFGIEDQGWIAWFAIATMLDKRITVYGNGKQVRDVLYIDDLIRAFEMAVENIEKTSGEVYNIGGGPKNTLSILELISQLEELFGKTLSPKFDEWRPGDQKVFVSNIGKARKEFGWQPQVSPKEGIQKLVEWVKENKELFKHF